jgi:hypothetical protein
MKGSRSMNFQFSEQRSHSISPTCRRQQEGVCDLILTELNPLVVVDHLDGEATELKLITFGSVREPCPKCQQGTLRLVLRQHAVRMAHLFCVECQSCYDARYADGAPALTI